MRIKRAVFFIIFMMLFGCSKDDNVYSNYEYEKEKECEQYETQCFQDIIQLCKNGSWVDWISCRNQKTFCVDSKEGPKCSPTPQDDDVLPDGEDESDDSDNDSENTSDDGNTGNTGDSGNTGSDNFENKDLKVFFTDSYFELAIDTKAQINTEDLLKDTVIKADEKNGYIIWQKPLTFYNDSCISDLGEGGETDLQTYPEDVELYFAVNSTGEIRVAVQSDDLVHSLLLLTDTCHPGMAVTKHDFDGNDIPDEKTVYESHYSALDMRMTTLGWLAVDVYKYLYLSGYVLSGPVSSNDLLSAPVALHSYFGEEISIFYSAIYHQQADYEQYDESNRAWDELIHSYWSPANTWDDNMDLSRYFNPFMYSTPVSSVSIRAESGSPDNSSFVKFYASIEPFLNQNGAGITHKYFFDMCPVDVEFGGHTESSLMSIIFKMAFTGDVMAFLRVAEYMNNVENPPDSFDSNPKPYIYKLNSGWNYLDQ